MKTRFVHVRNVQCSLAKIFSVYSHDIVSTCNLKSFTRDMFFRMTPSCTLCSFS